MDGTVEQQMTLQLNRCALLVEKAELFNAPTDSDCAAFYRCNRTLAAHGPDGDEVHLEDCQPGRTCHCTLVG